MQSFKRLIEFYRDPKNGCRLPIMFIITMFGAHNLYRTINDFVWNSPWSRERITEPLDHFIHLAPFVVIMVLLLPVIIYCARRASIAPSWRVRVLEFLPFILLMTASLIVRSLYQAQVF